jgi:hypothetical protein
MRYISIAIADVGKETITAESCQLLLYAFQLAFIEERLKDTLSAK